MELKPSNLFSLIDQINPSEELVYELLGEVNHAAIQYNMFPVEEMTKALLEQLLDYGFPKYIGLTIYDKGVLFTFMDKDSFATLAIPFYQLTIYKTNSFTFYFQEQHIRLIKNARTSQLVQDLLHRKSEFEGLGYYGNIIG